MKEAWETSSAIPMAMERAQIWE